MAPPEHKRPGLRVGRVTFPLHLGKGRAVSWWKDGSKRRYVTAADEKALRIKLEKIAPKILSGQMDGAQLAAADHRSYLAAREALSKFSVPVDVAAREYASARELLGSVGLQEAVSFYRRHAGVRIVETKVAAAVMLFLLAQEAQGLSQAYRRQMRQDLARFQAAHGELLVSEITTDQIELFVDGTGHRGGKATNGLWVPASAVRRNQVRGSVATFFNFCRDRKFLLQERTTAAHSVAKRKVVDTAHNVWAPAHLKRALLTAAEHAPEWLPWTALQSLTLMRTGAILRLEWSNIHFEEALIEVPAASSKISRRFLVRMSPALVAWLEPWRHAKGPVCENKNVRRWADRLRSNHQFPYWKNVLRHSAISYRLAVTGDIQATAEEANTSARKIRTNYLQVRNDLKQLVTKADGERWFGTMPDTASNVVQATFGSM